MKRLTASFIAICLLAGLVACGKPPAGKSSTQIGIKNGLFDCTADDLISTLNEYAEAAQIPIVDYDGSYGESRIFGNGLTLDFLESDGGLKSVTLYWYLPNGTETEEYAGFYIGSLLSLFDSDSAEALSAELLKSLNSSGGGYNNQTLKGTAVMILVTTHGNGGANLCFQPIPQ